MNKFGLFLDFLGFVMLFWQSVWRRQLKIEDGGGSGTTLADEEFQMERALLKWIKSEETRTYLTANLINFTFALFALFAAKLSVSQWLIINVNDSLTASNLFTLTNSSSFFIFSNIVSNPPELSNLIKSS